MMLITPHLRQNNTSFTLWISLLYRVGTATMLQTGRSGF